MKFSFALPGTSVVGMRQKAEQEDDVICYISNERLRSRSDTDIRIHPEPKGRNVRFKLDFKCIASCISSITTMPLVPQAECIRGISCSINCSIPVKLFRAVSLLRTRSSHTDLAQKYTSFVPTMCSHL